jgi:predicted DNA-binding ArsR family transcriptional regulator
MSLDSIVVSVLRLIHSEICRSISADAGSIRTHVASRLLEAAHCGKKSERELRVIGHAALLEAKAIARHCQRSRGDGGRNFAAPGD